VNDLLSVCMEGGSFVPVGPLLQVCSVFVYISFVHNVSMQDEFDVRFTVPLVCF
jgi:hypothetical protein